MTAVAIISTDALPKTVKNIHFYKLAAFKDITKYKVKQKILACEYNLTAVKYVYVKFEPFSNKYECCQNMFSILIPSLSSKIEKNVCGS